MIKLPTQGGKFNPICHHRAVIALARSNNLYVDKQIFCNYYLMVVGRVCFVAKNAAEKIGGYAHSGRYLDRGAIKRRA